MKVAYFIGSLNRGGTEMLTLDICRKKDYAPFDMILIYRNDGDLTNEFKATGVPLFRIKPKRLKISYFIEVRKLLKEEQVDIVHAQTLTNATAAVLFTIFLKVKLVASFHGFYTSYLKLILRHFVMWNADALIFVSDYVRKWYISRTLFCPKQKCNVVYNGIDFGKLDIKYDEPEFLKNDEGLVKLVMVGNFTKVRSQIVICKSLKLLKEQGINNVEFYFVGKRVDSEPWLYDECIDYCKRNGLMDFVHFMGSRGDVPAILQHVDGFVYSSVHDTFGIAVIEAMASRLPTIVNDWEVMKEVNRGKNWAVFFCSNDERDCCTKIRELIVGNNTQKKEAERISVEVREEYSIEKHIDSLAKIYENSSSVLE